MGGGVGGKYAEVAESRSGGHGFCVFHVFFLDLVQIFHLSKWNITSQNSTLNKSIINLSLLLLTAPQQPQTQGLKPSPTLSGIQSSYHRGYREHGVQFALR